VASCTAALGMMVIDFRSVGMQRTAIITKKFKSKMWQNQTQEIKCRLDYNQLNAL